MHNRDRLVAGICAALMAVPAVLVSFGAVTGEQAAALVGLVAAFAAGYRVDRGAASDALSGDVDS